jgi:hypothetical protein
MFSFKGILFVFLFLFICKFHLAYPFEEVKFIDIRTLSLGQMNALSQGLLNPAYLPFHERKEMGVSVFNRFEMKELSTRSIFGLIPNRLLDMSFHLSMFGYNDYQLIEGQAGFAKKVSSRFSIGTSISYLVQNSILEDRNQTFLQADVSFLWRISDAFDWALTTENLIHTRNSQPVSCFSGIKYQLAPTICILLETGMDSQNQFNISAGLEYEIVKQLTARGGFRNNPKTPSIGFAYKMEHWNIETAFLFHPALGLSSGIAATYSF